MAAVDEVLRELKENHDIERVTVVAEDDDVKASELNSWAQAIQSSSTRALTVPLVSSTSRRSHGAGSSNVSSNFISARFLPRLHGVT